MTLEFSNVVNIGLSLLCLVVMVQCLRLDRSLKHLKNGGLSKNVAAINTATENARAVLNQLKHTLSTDGVKCAAAVEKAKEASDELNVMIGIGGSMADRLVKAAEAAPKVAEQPAAKKAPAKRKAPAKKPAAKKAAPKTKAATKPKTTSTRKKVAAKPAATKKAPVRKKAASQTATAADIKVPVRPANGKTTLRLVGADEPTTAGKVAKVA